MIISLDTKKASEKIQYLFMERLRIQGTYLSIVKEIYSNLIAKSKFNRDTQNNYTKIMNKPRLSSFSISIQYCTKFLVWAIKQPKVYKGIHIGKRYQSIVIFRWFESMHKWSLKYYQGTPTVDEHLQHSSFRKLDWFITRLTKNNSSFSV